jgi:hypothetical protein
MPRINRPRLCYAVARIAVSLVRAYVEAQARSVTVTTNPGRGSTFTIKLPNLTRL